MREIKGDKDVNVGKYEGREQRAESKEQSEEVRSQIVESREL
jgi:hypothetical protein